MYLVEKHCAFNRLSALFRGFTDLTCFPFVDQTGTSSGSPTVYRIYIPYVVRKINFEGFTGFIYKPNLMKDKTTLNDYLIYAFCGAGFLWALYVLFS